MGRKIPRIHRQHYDAVGVLPILYSVIVGQFELHFDLRNCFPSYTILEAYNNVIDVVFIDVPVLYVQYNVMFRIHQTYVLLCNKEVNYSLL